mmetsp:Transcript_47675/g.137232  ORF Transcript_47675/g.137232 Transcript_47675/m.137232 type:complete len:470 (-) Transcript_47675:79-1488(-)
MWRCGPGPGAMRAAPMRLAALLAAAGARAAAGEDACGCGCCIVSFRPPSMQLNGAETMCIASETCPAQCQAGDMNTMAASTDGGVLETSRYCMMDCLPRSRDVRAGCAELTEEQARQLMTDSGNGEDPASLAIPRRPELPANIKPQRPDVTVDAAEAVQAADVQAFSEMAADAVAKANEPPIPGIQQQQRDRGALIADAAGKRAVAAGLSAQAGQANADSAASVVNSTYAYKRSLMNAKSANEAKGMVLSAKVQAAIYARSAQESATLAQKEIEEILAAPDQAAEEAATAAEKQFREDIEQWNREKAEADKAIELGTPPPPRTWAGEQVAKPYVAAAQRAQSARFMLEGQSQQLGNLAEQLRRSASKVLAQAKTYQAVGNKKVADDLLMKSQGLLRQAKNAQQAADRDAEQANTVQGYESVYMSQASQATQRADVISRLYWLPPPPGGRPAASFLQRAPAPTQHLGFKK